MIQPKKTTATKRRNLFGRQWDWIKKHRVVIVLALIGFFGLNTWSFWVDLFKSDYQKYKEGRTIDLIDAPFEVGNTIMVHLGDGMGMSVVYEDELAQKNFAVNLMRNFGCDFKGTDLAFSPYVKIKRHHFVFSVVVKDLISGEVIATVTPKSRLLIKDQAIDYYCDDRGFEIVDKQGFVPFSMWLDETDELHVKGYFVGNSCVMFINKYDPIIVMRNNPDFESLVRKYAFELRPHYKQHEKYQPVLAPTFAR